MMCGQEPNTPCTPLEIKEQYTSYETCFKASVFLSDAYPGKIKALCFPNNQAATDLIETGK